MSKHQHQSKKQQIDSKIHDTVQQRQDNLSYQKRKKNTQINTAVDDQSIQVRAYEIYNEKGGSMLDNWLEAERNLGNSDPIGAGLVNKSNLNI